MSVVSRTHREKFFCKLFTLNLKEDGKVESFEWMTHLETWNVMWKNYKIADGTVFSWNFEISQINILFQLKIHPEKFKTLKIHTWVDFSSHFLSFFLVNSRFSLWIPFGDFFSVFPYLLHDFSQSFVSLPLSLRSKDVVCFKNLLCWLSNKSIHWEKLKNHWNSLKIIILKNLGGRFQIHFLILTKFFGRIWEFSCWCCQRFWNSICFCFSFVQFSDSDFSIPRDFHLLI